MRWSVFNNLTKSDLRHCTLDQNYEDYPLALLASPSQMMPPDLRFHYQLNLAKLCRLALEMDHLWSGAKASQTHPRVGCADIFLTAVDP